jgi:hypothetical protein
MTTQNKLSIKIRDLEPLGDVMGGRRRHHKHAHAHAQAQATAFGERRSDLGEYTGGLGPFGLNRIP